MAKDFFGREIKDGDFLFRAKNAGRSYTTEVILAVDCHDGKRRYINVSGYRTLAKLPCSSNSVIIVHDLVKKQYPDEYVRALDEAQIMRMKPLS